MTVRKASNFKDFIIISSYSFGAIIPYFRKQKKRKIEKIQKNIDFAPESDRIAGIKAIMG
jgi:hypothetical protein